MQEESRLEPIQAVSRALQILEIIACKGSMSLNDLYKEMKVSKASLLRLAYTLVQNKFLEKNPQTGNYSLTIRTFEIGVRSIQNVDKLSLINSVLTDLSLKTGRVAQFSIEDHNQLLCIQSIGEKFSPFSAFTGVGTRSPLYCTSAGKAILASYSNSQVLEKWEAMDIKKLTEHTITDVHVLLEDLSQTRQRRYALDLEENEYDVFCVGSVVLGSANTPVGAVSVTGRSLSSEDEQRIAAALLPATQLLSEYMGHITVN